MHSYTLDSSTLADPSAFDSIWNDFFIKYTTLSHDNHKLVANYALKYDR